MRICTCNHLEAFHRGDGKCGACNCVCFEEESLIQRVGKLEERVVNLERLLNRCTCVHAPHKHSATGGCFAADGCQCKATYEAANEKQKPSKCPSNWNPIVLGYHAVCERYSRALYEDYYLKSEVDAYLRHMGAIK